MSEFQTRYHCYAKEIVKDLPWYRAFMRFWAFKMMG
jgi:hypothetical protein